MMLESSWNAGNSKKNDRLGLYTFNNMAKPDYKSKESSACYWNDHFEYMSNLSVNGSHDDLVIVPNSVELPTTLVDACQVK